MIYEFLRGDFYAGHNFSGYGSGRILSSAGKSSGTAAGAGPQRRSVQTSGGAELDRFEESGFILTSTLFLWGIFVII